MKFVNAQRARADLERAKRLVLAISGEDDQAREAAQQEADQWANEIGSDLVEKLLNDAAQRLQGEGAQAAE